MIPKILFLMAWALSAQASFFPGDGPMPLANSKSHPARAEQLLTRFQTEQESLVREKNAELVILPLWEDGRVNARALRKEHQWYIEVYGGLLNHPDIGEDELLLILCHELGHHLAGEPTASRGGWSACEGQADYWSGKFCGHILTNAKESAVRLARLYASQGTGGYPQLDTPDVTKVLRTFFGYPTPQCRLDTILAGLNGVDRPECWYHP